MQPHARLVPYATPPQSLISQPQQHVAQQQAQLVQSQPPATEQVVAQPSGQAAIAQSSIQACQGCNCKENGKDIEKKLNNILKKTVTKLLVGLSQVLIEFSKPREQGQELDAKAQMETITRTIGKTLDEALASDSDDTDSEGDPGDSPEEDIGEAAAVDSNEATSSKFIIVRECSQRKKREQWI